MARFRYRMQNILNIKERQEEMQRNALAAARLKLREEEEKLSGLMSRRADYREEGRAMRVKALSVLDIMANNHAVSTMDEMIASQRSHVARAEKNVEIERQRLTEAMQERKMHEKLREKAFEKFLKEERALEAKTNDERSSFIYGQKTSYDVN
ncbi:MAG: flagellar export protein FliJ [Lachnospiraceae bacterium]|nr:flagellar export protein FliJ [Lachnospiraceae bacterium]